MLSNSGINKVILLGQITSEPKMVTLDDKSNVYNFTLVTTELLKKGDKTSEHQEYHNIVVSEKLLSYEKLQLSSGQIVFIEGKLQTRAFTDEKRVKRYNLEIITHKIEVMSFVSVVV